MHCTCVGIHVSERLHSLRLRLDGGSEQMYCICKTAQRGVGLEDLLFSGPLVGGVLFSATCMPVLLLCLVTMPRMLASVCMV